MPLPMYEALEDDRDRAEASYNEAKARIQATKERSRFNTLEG